MSKLDHLPPVIGKELADELGIVGTSADDPSGRSLAQAAHDAGAVLPPIEEPNHHATIHLVVHGPLEEAHELVQAIAGRLIDHPAVRSVNFGITTPEVSAT